MKKSLFLMPLAGLMLMGAGCMSARTVVAPTIPSTSTVSTSTVTQPSATSTAPVIVHADWKTDPIFGGLTFRHPGKIENLDPTSDEVKQGLKMRVALGTAVQNPGSKDVPERKLEVWKLNIGDERIAGCSTALVGKSGISSVQSVSTPSSLTYCLQKSSSAGAGNYYDSETYVLITSDGPYAFVFTTHSVQCMNYPNPAAQCVSFDEVRDNAIFREIVNTISR